MRRVAGTLCAAVCFVSLATAAQTSELTTYTWETLSQSSAEAGGITPNLQLSFTVDGNVSFGAGSGSAPPSNPPTPFPTPFPFPPQLVAFNLSLGNLSVTFDSLIYACEEQFVCYVFDGQSEVPYAFYGYPSWDLSLEADTANQTGDLDISFIDRGEQNEIFGEVSTTGGRFYFGSDDSGDCFFQYCTYTGILVPSVVPEPPSLWVLIAGISLLWLCWPGNRRLRDGGHHCRRDGTLGLRVSPCDAARSRALRAR